MQRKFSESGFYHIFARGVGRMLLFEDGDDYRFFSSMLSRYGAQAPEVHAWCLMPNHYHLLVRGGMEEIAQFMARLNTQYAAHFNERHGHVGHVFQGRYGSQPIGSERQLLATIRYIHRNPLGGGLSSTCEYPWSSFPMYLRMLRQREETGSAKLLPMERATVLDLLPNLEAFETFHAMEADDEFDFLDDGAPQPRSRTHPMRDEQALRIAESMFGGGWRLTLPLLPQERRNQAIRQLRAAGLSIRQIERLTGIGRNIIAAA